MTEEVKKETPKTKLPGLPPLAAFIYAVLIFIMTMGYLKVFLIMGFRMNPEYCHFLRERFLPISATEALEPCLS